MTVQNKRPPKLIVSNIKQTQASLVHDQKANFTQKLKEKLSKELIDKVETHKNKMAPTTKVEPQQQHHDLKQNLIRR